MDEPAVCARKPYVDYTLVKADATMEDFRRFCEKALEEENRLVIRSVCVLPDPRIIKFCKKILEGSGILLSTVNDFPLGRGGKMLKLYGALTAKEAGADEIDTKLNAGLLREINYKDVIEEIAVVVKVFPKATKVIIESGHQWYNERIIKEAAHLVATTGAFCVKTSTTVVDNIAPEEKNQHVVWMHESEPDLVKKAAGGYRKISQVKPLWKVIPPDKLIVGSSVPFWKNP
ncbi:MAG: hypothetical protein HYX20_01750 [Candidatus Yanofskybacteria bacterium]|nr:hypothetical protein [Candidatus Yanofskybacteria bacterium]